MEVNKINRMAKFFAKQGIHYRTENIEKLLIAYYYETDIPASEAVLVETFTGDGLSWHIERK